MGAPGFPHHASRSKQSPKRSEAGFVHFRLSLWLEIPDFSAASLGAMVAPRQKTKNRIKNKLLITSATMGA